MIKAIFYLVAAALLTAVFSYSLQVFLQASFTTLTLKTMLIPCFTWTVLLGLAYFLLSGEKRKRYFILAGWVCMIGSAALVPAGIYNFISNAPRVQVSVISVIFSVGLMSFLFYRGINKMNLALKWWLAFNILICINMSLFYLSVNG